jgi:hypothetical protein
MTDAENDRDDERGRPVPDPPPLIDAKNPLADGEQNSGDDEGARDWVPPVP